MQFMILVPKIGFSLVTYTDCFSSFPNSKFGCDLRKNYLNSFLPSYSILNAILNSSSQKSVSHEETVSFKLTEEIPEEGPSIVKKKKKKSAMRRDRGEHPLMCLKAK